MIKIIDMEKIGRRYIDVTKWITKVINSCVTWEQVTTCQRLVDNFKKQMVNEGYDEILMLVYIVELNLRVENKRKELVEGKTLTICN